MSFLQYLSSNNQQVNRFKLVQSHLTGWQRILGLVLFWGFFIAVLAPLYLSYFERKPATTISWVIFFGGLFLFHFIVVKTLGSYRVLGTIEVTDDELLLKSSDGEILETVPFEQMALIKRLPGISLSLKLTRGPSTSRVQIQRKGQPPLQFESEWSAGWKFIDLEDLVVAIRQYRNLPLF